MRRLVIVVIVALAGARLGWLAYFSSLTTMVPSPCGGAGGHAGTAILVSCVMLYLPVTSPPNMAAAVACALGGAILAVGLTLAAGWLHAWLFAERSSPYERPEPGPGPKRTFTPFR